MNHFEMPVGLCMALAMNPEAMQKFQSLTEMQKWEIVSGTYAVESGKDMQQYVQNIILLIFKVPPFEPSQAALLFACGS